MAAETASVKSADLETSIASVASIESITDGGDSSESLTSISFRITHTPPMTPKPEKNVVIMEPPYKNLSSMSNNHYRTFQDVLKMLQERYTYRQSTNSLALDLISIYLEGQKILYIESKTYCEIYLYRLMLPAIFISSLSSVISGIFNTVPYASMAVSLMTAINAFILSLVTYLKLDAKAEAHKSSAYSFEKLQAVCEFKSGKILLTQLGKDDDQMMNIIDEMEEKVKEIKEKNQFILPEAVRFRYPVIYTTNIFSEVKQIQTEEMVQINNLKVIINKGVDLEQMKELKTAPDNIDELIYQNYLDKNNAIEKVILFRKKYNVIDDDFKKEITENIDKIRLHSYRCCNWLKT